VARTRAHSLISSALPPIDRPVPCMASDVRRLTRALIFAAEAHRNHRRKGASQEPYINHLIEVLDLVASVEGDDMDVLIAALLHDVLEDRRPAWQHDAGRLGLQGSCRATPACRTDGKLA
jgi:(p)ppGpp synthase/HD superfamily hydrolase